MSDHSAEIVSLRTQTPVNAKVVREIEELLAQAKAGVIQALAYAAVRRDHARITSWQPADGYHHDLAAGVLHLHARVGRILIDSPETDPLPEDPTR